MYMCCIVLAVLLLAIAAGVVLLIWGYRNQGVGVALAKVFGYIITIISIIMFLCVSSNCSRHMIKGKGFYEKSFCKIHNDKCFCKKHSKIEGVAGN